MVFDHVFFEIKPFLPVFRGFNNVFKIGKRFDSI